MSEHQQKARNEATRQRILGEIAKQLADEGRLIEVGWINLQRLALPADAPPIQIREMRHAYMAGAQHLFASIMGILDPGEEPTEADLKRLDLIAKELSVFGEEVMAAVKAGHWPT